MLRTKAFVLVGLMGMMAAAALAAQGAPAGRDAGRAGRALVVEYENGSLQGIVEFMVELCPHELNVAFGPGAADLTVPPMKMKNTNVFAVVDVLESVVPGLEVKLDFGNRPFEIDEAAGKKPGEIDALVKEHGTPTLIFLLDPDELLELPKKALRVFSVRAILEQKDVDMENLADALSTASRMATGTPGELKFHPQTGVLICSGTEAQVEAMSQVVETLLKEEAARKQEREAQAGPQAKIAELEQVLRTVQADMKMQLSRKEMQIDALMREKRELEKQLEKANATLEALRGAGRAP